MISRHSAGALSILDDALILYFSHSLSQKRYPFSLLEVRKPPFIDTSGRPEHQYGYRWPRVYIPKTTMLSHDQQMYLLGKPER